MPRDSRTQTAPYPPFRSAFAQGLLVLAALAAVFLAGSERQGATGIFLTAAGALMVFVSPNRAVAWRYWALCGGMLACAALCLLPQAWFYAPPWRIGLQEYRGLPPLPMVTLAPRETMYWLMLLAGALLTGLYSLGHPVRSGVKVYVALLGALGCAAYAAVAIYAKTTGWEYPFMPKGVFTLPDFGFFPNRNHTAALLVTGAVLTLGILREGWSGRRPVVFVLAGGALAVCVYALLFESTSRGGVVFLVVGSLVWVAMLGRGHLSTPLLVSAAAVGLLVAGIFFTTESEVRTRVLEFVGLHEPRSEKNQRASGEEKPASKPAAFSDFRLNVFQDAVKIIRDYPITGTGLGTYAFVSPFYVDASIGEAIPIHPESDWLMGAAESGLPFVICAAALLFVLIRDMQAFRRSETWPLRWGIAAAALAAVLHGFVDVPLHRVEIGWWVLVLAGLAFGNPAPTGTERNAAWLVQRLIFGAAGAGLLALGILLIRTQWYGGVPFPPYRAAIVVNQMRQLADAGRFEEAVNLARSEIPLSPMAVGLYRELGFREIKRGGNTEVADAVFAAERALNPVSAQLAFDQGLLWLRDDPMRSAELYVEGMKKLIRIQQSGRYANPVEVYGRMLGQARENPEMLAKLGEASRLSPELRLVWISHTRAADGFTEAAEDKEFLAALDAPMRRRFLESWWNGGDKQALEAFLAANPDWEEDAWSLRIRQKVERKEFQAAVEAVQTRYGIDLSLPESSEEELARGEPPPGLAESVAFYFAKGNPVSARRMIAESVLAKEPEGHRLQCAIAVRTGDWESAWKAMQALLASTNRSGLP